MSTTQRPAGAPTYKLLTRSNDRWLGGVCAGLADYLGVDVTLVRLLTVVATVLGVGTLIPVYAVAWVLVPRRDRDWRSSGVSEPR
jgi:phage shock protein C